MSDAEIKFNIQASNPQAHLFTVSCEVLNPDPLGQIFALPAWIPGSYMIRDFAKHIISFSAKAVSTGNESEIAVSKIDKQSWRCEPCQGKLKVEYQVYAWDLSVRGAHLDTRHAFFNGSCVFMEVLGQEDKNCELLILAPSGNQYLHWRVATSMPRKDAKLFQFGRYICSNYSELIDHPVEIGDFDMENFTVGGVPHHFVVTGKHHSDLKRIVKDIQILCEHHVDLFTELPEMERYVFFLTCVGSGYGGLEHRASCSLICSRNDLPREQEKNISDEYRTFLSLCSHEYFHTWNVKRLKPRVFIAEKLDQEIYTKLLWFFEGITSYYDDLSLSRTGLISEQNYLDLLAQQITRYLRTPGRHLQTVCESSFDAWTKFYKQDENAANSIISYYNKGALVSCLLDLNIRIKSNHTLSLDDVMRGLWQRFGKNLLGVDENELEQSIAEIVDLDLVDFFKMALYSKQDLEFTNLLLEFGVNYKTRVANNFLDRGGSVAKKDNQTAAYFGATLKPGLESAILGSVLSDSPFQKAGLSAFDQLVAINDIKVNAKNFESVISRYQAEEILKIHVFRGDELIDFEVILEESRQQTCYLELSAEHHGWLRL